MSSAAVSPTAHYTGHVWMRNGLSHRELASWQGRAMFAALQPVMAGSRAAGGPSLESYLLVRHRAIDALLEDAIAEGAVGQVIEIAAGLSARGWRFAERHGSALTYVETDLPGMADRKRDALARMGALRASHSVIELDALRPGGDGSLEAVAATLDPQRGVAVVTEGLLSYLETPAVLGLWARIAGVLSSFPTGLYLSDLLPRAVDRRRTVAAARWALGRFVGGSVTSHFSRPEDAESALCSAGFASAAAKPAVSTIGRGRSELPAGASSYVIEARTGRGQHRPG